MKCRSLIFIFIFACFFSVSHAQEIVKTVKNLALIKIDALSPYQMGDIVNIYNMENGEYKRIAEAKVVLIRGTNCAVKITSASQLIKIGDLVAKTGAQNLMDSQSGSQTTVRKNHTLTYIALGAGAIMTGMGYNYYNKTVQTFDDYQAAQTSEKAVSLYKDAEDYYGKTKTSLAIGGGLVVVGLINELFIKPSPAKPQKFSLHSGPAEKAVTLSFNF